MSILVRDQRLRVIKRQSRTGAKMIFGNQVNR